MADATTTIAGNVTRDPELRFTQSGQARLVLGGAVNKRRRNPDTQQWEDGDPSFFNVVAWGDLAENIASSVGKGHRVIVTGRLDQRTWDSDDGKRSVVEIVADEVGPSLRWATTTVERNPRKNRRDVPANSSQRDAAMAAINTGFPQDEEPFLKRDDWALEVGITGLGEIR